MVGRTRNSNQGESEDDAPPGVLSKPKNFVRTQYSRGPMIGGPRNFNRSKISSVSSDGGRNNGSYTPKPPTSVRELNKEYTKTLAEAMSNLTDKSEREPSQRWTLPGNNALDSSDDDEDIIDVPKSRPVRDYQPPSSSKAPSIRMGNGTTLTKELGRLEKALTDVENADGRKGWSKLKSNLAVATRINASDRVRDMAVAAASAALIRKSMMAEPTKVPDIVKEMAHAAATAAAKKKKSGNEKEIDRASSRTLKAVRPPSSRTLPPDERPVSSMYPPPNEVSITTSVRSVLPGIKRGPSNALPGSQEDNLSLQSTLKNGNLRTSEESMSSIEDDINEPRSRRISKNITSIMNTPVDGDTIIGVPSQISDPGYAATRTAHQRLAEQTTLAAKVRNDAIRERKETLEMLREGGGSSKDNYSGSVRSSSKADEVVKRLTNPAAFTGISKVRFDESTTPNKQPPAALKKAPSVNANKIDFFSTFDEGSNRMRRNVSASMNTLNAFPKQIPEARNSNKNYSVSSSDAFSMPRLVSNVPGSSANLKSQKATAALRSVDTLRTRRSLSNEPGRVLNKSDETSKSQRKGERKSGSNSLRGSSESLEDEEAVTDSAFGMHNRYWPAEEGERNASLEELEGEEATKHEKRRRKKEAKASASRLLDKSNYTGVHRFGSTNRLAAPGRSPWNVI